MDTLLIQSMQKCRRVPVAWRRYLAGEIPWNERLIGIMGARGVGKTTLILQHASLDLPLDQTVLYVSCDEIVFAEHTLYALAKTFAQHGGRHLLLDEIHRYSADWSREIKLIHDNLPELFVVFSGSSILQLQIGSADLSRRALLFELSGLSYREFLQFQLDLNLPILALNDLVGHHTQFAQEICEQVLPLAHFDEYLKYGYCPYYFDSKETYMQRLKATVNTALSLDLLDGLAVPGGNLPTIRKLLAVLAQSVPFKPNISKLSERIGLSRNTLLTYLNYLQDLKLTRHLFADSVGVSKLQKPDKILLHHPNLHYALAYQSIPNIGAVRESFFVNQLANKVPVEYSRVGDFRANNFLFEVGVPNKRRKQLQGDSMGLTVVDGIEVGISQRIPLWLFGFLY